LQESKLDIMDTREEQLKVLVPYLKGQRNCLWALEPGC